MEKKEKILIIEDEFILTLAMKTSFSQNYDVVIAMDGEAGYNMVYQEKPHIILLDIFLPKMNGFDLLEKIKKDNKVKNIPVIILSNCGGEEDMKKGINLGAAAYLVKADTDLKEIEKHIEKILSQ